MLNITGINSRTVGFETFVDAVNKMLSDDYNQSATSGYPPTNIIKQKDNHYVIEMAVAGIPRNSLNVVLENNELIVSSNGNKQETSEYLYRGISTRQFIKSFRLAETVNVTDVVLDNGILSIYLENIIPEHKKPKILKIQAKDETVLEKPPNRELLLEDVPKEKVA